MFGVCMLVFAIKISGDLQNPELVVDGSLSTYAVSSKKGGYFGINFGNPLYIDKVVFLWKERIPEIKFEYSLDGVRWEEPESTSVLNGCYKKDCKSVFLLRNDAAQFIKVTYSEAFKLAEVYIYKANPLVKLASSLTLKEAGEDYAVFSFKTTAPAYGSVCVGTSREKVEESSHTVCMNLGTEHLIKVENLKPGERYYAKAIIRDLHGSEVDKSEIIEFYTKGDPQPYFDVIKASPWVWSVAFFVKTSVPSRLKVILKKDNKPVWWSQYDYPSTEKMFVAEGLTPETVYTFELKAFNTAGTRWVEYKGEVKTRSWNVALNKPVRGTFNNPDIADNFKLKPPIISRVVDGSLFYREGMACSFDPAKKAQWVQIDLQKKYALKCVKTYWRALCYPRDFSVLVSNDGKHWQKVAEHLDAGKVKTWHSPYGDPIKIVETSLKGEWRYVKIYIPKGAKYYRKFKNYRFVQLYEVEVIADHTKRGGEKHMGKVMKRGVERALAGLFNRSEKGGDKR